MELFGTSDVLPARWCLAGSEEKRMVDFNVVDPGYFGPWAFASRRAGARRR